MIDIKPSQRNKDFYPIKGYEGIYEISKDGLIYSIGRNKILKKLSQNIGYDMVCLWKNKKGKKWLIHRLMANNFLGIIDNKVINHKDLNKKNNNIDNLEICSVRHNQVHYRLNSLNKIGYNKVGDNSYRAVIYVDNKPLQLGYYNNEIEAQNAYYKAKKLLEENKIEDILNIKPKIKHKNYSFKKGAFEVYIKRKYIGRFKTEIEAKEIINKILNDTN